MKRTTFSLRFFIREKNHPLNGESPVYLRLTVNRQKVEWSIQLLNTFQSSDQRLTQD